MTIAAYFPDIDTLTGLRGPVVSFQHHRGITHTLTGVPFEAALITACFYGLHRWRLYRRSQQPKSAGSAKPLTVAPVHWPRLYGFVLIALLSHLLLDFTNNYGLRPFFPFHPQWYAASIVFIFDPLIFFVLLLPFVLPPLFRLIGAEVGARKQLFPGRTSAIAALLFVVSIWTMRELSHNRAEQIAVGQSVTVPQANAEAPPTLLLPVRVLANPDPFNPFRWHMVTDFGDFYQLGEVNLLNGSLISGQELYAKPPRTAAVLAAQASPVGRAYMDWSPMPFITQSLPGESGSVPEAAAGSAQRTTVTFRDPRFMIDLPLFRSRSAPPLTATVEVDEQNRVVQQTMDGRIQR